MARLPFKLTVATDLPRFGVTLSDFARRRLPKVEAEVLTQAARYGRGALIAEMRSVFDRPTPWTLGGAYVKPATERDLTASYYFKDSAGGGVPAGRYLAPQILGGRRDPKSFERRLAAVGAIPAGWVLVPTAAAEQDAYGNASPGLIVKILSSLDAFTEVGFRANAYGRRGRGVRRDETFFAVRPGDNRPQFAAWPPGIYRRRAGGQAQLVFLAAEAAGYQPRLDFYGVADRAYARFVRRHLPRAMADAMRAARP